MVVFAYEFNLHHLWTCLREHCLCYPLEDPLVDELELALTLSTQITLAESRKNVQDFLRSVLRGQTTFNERGESQSFPSSSPPFSSSPHHLMS